MKKLIVCLALAASACAAPYTENQTLDFLLGGARASARQFPVGDGRTGYEVTCDGASTMSACYQRAQHYCPNGFEVLDQNQSATYSTAQRSLMFVCRPAG